MNNSFFNTSLVLSSIVLLLLVGTAIGANRSAERLDIAGDFEALEETGLGDIANPQTIIEMGRTRPEKEPSINIILEEGVLLIPNSTDGNVGMYDPADGTFLGLFITGYEGFYTPINAVPGPDGNVYVSDQVEDAVYVFDMLGNYLYTYADETDGLNNIRGIDFRGDTLFVTSGDDYVAMFDGPHSRLVDFINDGSDPYDIMFLDDGRALLADIQGTTDNVRLYNADGSLARVLFTIAFPEQIQIDALAPGDYLNASFTGDQITDFDLDGTIQQTTPWDAGRGVYRLGNGNLLATSGNGVFEIEPITGNIIEQENTGSARLIELYIGLPSNGYIHGQVLEDVSTPVEDVDVSVYDSDDSLVGTDTTDSNGEFDFSLSQGTYYAMFSKAGYNDTTLTDLDVVSDETTYVSLIMYPSPGCDYVPGDINGDDNVMGNDVTYGVRYFKGIGPQPPDSCWNDSTESWLYSAGDANGSCTFTGSDITFLVAYFKGYNPAILWCPQTPPAEPPGQMRRIENKTPFIIPEG
jgi:hypothetical protein